MNSPFENWFFCLFIVIYALLLAILAYFVIYYPVQIALPLAILGPVLVSALHYFRISPLYYNELFGIGKLYLINLGAILSPLIVLKILPLTWLGPVVMLLLSANVLEAISVDLFAAYKKLAENDKTAKNHLLNAVAGFAVILTFFLTIHISWKYPFICAESNHVIFWILAYTLWNWNFVVLNFPDERSIITLAFLLAAIIFMSYFKDLSYWLIARTVTLSIGQMIQGIIGSLTALPYIKSPHYTSFISFIKKIGMQPIWCIAVIVLCLLS